VAVQAPVSPAPWAIIQKYPLSGDASARALPQTGWQIYLEEATDVPDLDKDDIREIQEDRQDFLEGRQEDRQDFIDEHADDDDD
jgi:hypothetical protein